MDMRKSTIILIATALAVAVAGPASAAPKFAGEYVGDKLQVKVNPQGCKNLKLGKTAGFLSFAPNIDVNVGGWWFLNSPLFLGIDLGDLEDNEIHGPYIESKIDKELTGAVEEDFFSDCVIVEGLPVCDFEGGLLAVVQAHLVTECGGAMTAAQAVAAKVTKGKVKLSKSTDRAKVDFKLEGEYENDGKTKKWNATLKSPQMDFAPGAGI